ncbi:MAG: penicillin-binding protein 2, partial [Gemmatimonadota bacterium]
MKQIHPVTRRLRARGAMAVIAVVIGVLVVAFFRLQVLRSTTWELRSESNRLRPLPLPAPRGTILDRNGRVLADNVQAYSISLLPAPTDSMRSTLDRLVPLLGVGPEEAETLRERVSTVPREPVVVVGDATFDQVSAVEERRPEFPRVLIETRPKRRYLLDDVTSHVLGYVGEVTVPELLSERFADYEQGMVVGKEGIERQYEERLQGTRGIRYVEVDARGRIVGSFRGVSQTPARKGEDITLNLDAELQQWIHEIFPDTLSGAVVALDVRDGGVLALYSAPGYDPNAFVGGIDPEVWQGVNRDPAQPLFNRTVMGLYPPASTWKLATAAIALELGVVAPDEVMEQPCTGGIQFGNRYFRCWEPDGHGDVDLVGAIRDSCDVYFYQLGIRIGLSRLLEEGTRLGFSQRCEIDLPQESRGIFPEGREFWLTRFGNMPTDAETLNMAIGQGPNSQTPLKMAQFYLALAGDGSAPNPTIADVAPIGQAWSLDLSSESLRSLRAGLRAVTAPGGTAYLSSLEHWDLLGKTGTGQNSQDPERDHAWFAGMAGPLGGAPEIVVVALVEFGLSGSQMAAPIVAKTADFWLRKKYGMPIDTIQTLGEHLRAGVPAPWFGEVRLGPGEEGAESRPDSTVPAIQPSPGFRPEESDIPEPSGGGE